MHSLDVAVAAGQVACIVSVCLLATLVFPAKRVNWLRCRLGCRLRWAQGTVLGFCHIHLPPSPPTRRDGFGSFWPFVKQWDFLLHSVQQSITAVTLNSPLYEKSTPCDVAYSQFLGIFVLITRCCCFFTVYVTWYHCRCGDFVVSRHMSCCGESKIFWQMEHIFEQTTGIL